MEIAYLMAGKKFKTDKPDGVEKTPKDIADVLNEVNQDIPDAKVRSTAKKIADLYFTPKRFERNGTLYKALGVKTWQKIVMGTAGRVIRKICADDYAENYFIGNDLDAKSLDSYVKETWINELIHTSLAISNVPGIIGEISQGRYGVAAGYGAALLINAYCTMLQRYNRERIYRVKDRFEKKSS